MGFLESRAAAAPEAPATFGDRSHCPFWMFRRAVGAGHHDERQGRTWEGVADSRPEIRCLMVQGALHVDLGDPCP